MSHAHLLVRSSDPVTSVEAAEQTASFSEQHRVRVMAALMRAGGRAGAEHISWLAGLQPYQTRKRLPELQRDGLVRPTDELTLTRSCRRERVWEVVA